MEFIIRTMGAWGSSDISVNRGNFTIRCDALSRLGLLSVCFLNSFRRSGVKSDSANVIYHRTDYESHDHTGPVARHHFTRSWDNKSNQTSSFSYFVLPMRNKTITNAMKQLNVIPKTHCFVKPILTHDTRSHGEGCITI